MRYGDPEQYELERERVLARGWHVVGDRTLFADEEIRAAPCTLLPGSLEVPLIATREGCALSNVCTHRGAILLEEPSSARVLRCPYHGRRFELDGSVAAAPGFDVVPHDEALPRVSLASLGPLWLASLAPEKPLEEMIAPLVSRLSFLSLDALVIDPAASRSFEIDAHWLLWCENYLEGMHIPYVHPRLARTLDLDRYEIECFPHFTLQIGEAAKDEPSFEVEGRRIAGFYAYLYPTTALNLYPWGLSLNLVRPLGPRRTRIEYRAYVLDESLRERGAGAGLDHVEEEDDAIVERAQRGVSSRLYAQGRLSNRHERAVSWLHDHIAADLAKPPSSRGG